MASSLISYHDKSFLVNDLILRIIIYYLAPLIEVVIEKGELSKENQNWFTSYYANLIFGLEWIIAGGIDLRLEDVAKNPDRMSFFISSMNTVKGILQSKGGELSISELQKINNWVVGEKIVVKKTRSTQDVITHIDLILDLLPTQA